MSLVALALAAAGLFALMSYSVSQRTGEFGVRLALGARHRDVASDVLRESLVITLAGTAGGLLAGVPIAIALNDGLLSTISWRAPVPAAAVTGLLVAVAVVATLGPVSRVFRIDPVRTLRQDWGARRQNRSPRRGERSRRRTLGGPFDRYWVR